MATSTITILDEDILSNITDESILNQIFTEFAISDPNSSFWPEIKIEVKARYHFEKGRMFERNGDPGYPDDEEFEILDHTIYICNKIISNDKFYQYFPTLDAEIDNYLEKDDLQEKFDFNSY